MDGDGRQSGGGGGIRTHGTLARTPVFKTGLFNHSSTPPGKHGPQSTGCRDNKCQGFGQEEPARLTRASALLWPNDARLRTDYWRQKMKLAAIQMLEKKV